MNITSVILIIAIIFVPAVLKWSSRKSGLENILSPIVLCYALGMLVGNTMNIDISIPKTFTEATIALAIPLILLPSDFGSFIRSAKQVLISFGIAIFSVLIFCLLGGYLFRDSVPDVHHVSAMLAGVYTGGTPNMSSIKVALGADDTLFPILNMADMVVSGVYLLLLTSVAPIFFRKILPWTKADDLGDISIKPQGEWGSFPLADKIKKLILPIGLTILIVGITVGLSMAIYGKIQEAFFIISITVLGILFSFFPFTRKLEGAYEAGDYLLLIFSFAVGMLSDFSKLLESGLTILLMTVVVMIGAILLHVILAKLFRIDADIFIITSTACIFGPVFVGQIASVLKNKNVLVPGMTMGVVGYAVGNFLGLFIAWALST